MQQSDLPAESSAMTAKGFGQYSLRSARSWFVSFISIYFVLTGPLAAQDAGSLAAQPVRPSAFGRATPDNARRLAQAIDAYFERYWASQDVLPAPPADDAELLRRASIDLAGRIPAVSEVREFLADASSDKRERLIDRLLGQGAYARHFANSWTDILLAGSQDNVQVRALAPRLETWLRLRFAANEPFDRIAAQLLLAPAERTAQPALAGDALADPGIFSPPPTASRSSWRPTCRVPCWVCKSAVPNATTIRMPIGRGRSSGRSRPCSASLPRAAPATTTRPTRSLPSARHRAHGPAENLGYRHVRPGGISRRLAARPLDRPIGAPALVLWLTGRQNPWFASAIVNRVWQQMLGRGLIDPADDLEAAGPNDHAELLTFVAGEFRAHGHDLQYLLRAIAGTRLYRLSSQRDPAQPTARHQFARMPLRKMTAVQLFDSLLQATGIREVRGARGPLGDIDSQRGAFQQKFAEPGGAHTDAETSILQALALMNGKLVVDATDLKTGDTLAGVLNAPFLELPAKVETLFLAALGRPPTAAESRQFVDYVVKRPPTSRPAHGWQM